MRLDLEGVDPASEALIFRRVPPGRVEVTAFDDQGWALAKETQTVGRVNEARVTLTLGGRELSISAVDLNGAPVADARVWAAFDEGLGHLFHGRTNDDGLVIFRGVPETEGALYVVHWNQGGVWGERLSLGVDEMAVELDLSRMQQVRLADEGFAVAGARLQLESVDRFVILDPRSDERGIAQIPGQVVSPAPFRVDERWLWPMRGVLRPGDETIQVYRIGGVELEFVDENEQPVAGVEWELTHLALGESSEEWIRDGRIDGPLRSSTEGTSVVEGVPRGSYRWSAHAPGSAPLTGNIEVPAGGMARAVVRIPTRR